MYGIFPYIYHRNQPTVGKYTPYMDRMGLESPTYTPRLLTFAWSTAREPAHFNGYISIGIGCIHIQFDSLSQRISTQKGIQFFHLFDQQIKMLISQKKIWKDMCRNKPYDNPSIIWGEQRKEKPPIKSEMLKQK